MKKIKLSVKQSEKMAFLMDLAEKEYGLKLSTLLSISEDKLEKVISGEDEIAERKLKLVASIFFFVFI